MSIVPKLFELYRRRGFTVLSGLNPVFWEGLIDVNFTWLIKDGASTTNGLGIALQEVFFLECLSAGYHPKRILVIGNSFGWSALALALANPDAEVVAIDAGFDQNALAGIELTNAIAAEAGLRLRALKATSPGDLPEISSAFGGSIDFTFVDGLHTNEQIVLDWRAVQAVAAPDAVYLFHDVHAWNLRAGIARIEAESGLTMTHLMATPSGMALAYPAALAPALAPVLAVFAPDAAALAVVDRAAWRRKHRRQLRWRRSLVKRGNLVRHWLGQPARPLP